MQNRVHVGVSEQASHLQVSDENVPSEYIQRWKNMFRYSAEQVESRFQHFSRAYVHSISSSRSQSGLTCESWSIEHVHRWQGGVRQTCTSLCWGELGLQRELWKALENFSLLSLFFSFSCYMMCYIYTVSIYPYTYFVIIQQYINPTTKDRKK